MAENGAQDSGQERTEEATPKRRQDLRKKGQVPRSKELNTLTSLLVSGFGVLVFGGQIIEGISQLFIDGLSVEREQAFEVARMGGQFQALAFDAVLMLLPLLALITIATIISPVSLGGFIFNPSMAQPKLERVSFIKGIGRMFSPNSLMELGKALGKFLLVSSVACLVLWSVLDTIIALPLMPLQQAFQTTGNLFIWCLLGFSAVLILVAAIDVPFQLWQFSKQSRMTRQEVKDEMKETEGKPEVKSAIREKQQAIARQRMMSEIPTADVVITNPTHYAVALRYEQGGRGAPRVVAKGRDLVAARIREIAQMHGITVFSAPPLARALYVSTDLEQEIPGNLFVAVAQVLAYVFQLRQASVRAGQRPRPPRNIKVPGEYDAMLRRGNAR